MWLQQATEQATKKLGVQALPSPPLPLPSLFCDLLFQLFLRTSPLAQRLIALSSIWRWGMGCTGQDSTGSSRLYCSQNSLAPKDCHLPATHTACRAPRASPRPERSPGAQAAPRAAEDPRGAPHLPSSSLVFSSYSSAISLPSGNK